MHSELISDIINCTLIGFSLFLGLLITLIFITNRELCRTASNKFLINFLATNFPVAIAGLVITARIRKRSKTIDQGDALTSSFLIVSLFTYLLGLLLVTIDRFIAIICPFIYAERMTRKNVCRIIVAFWITVAAFFTFAITRVLVDTDNGSVTISHTILLVASLIGIVALLIINTVIFYQIRRQVRYLNTVSVGDSDDNRRFLRRSEKKAAYLCFAMVVTQAICWLPHTIAGMKTEKKQYMQLIRYTTSLYYVSLVINAFLYIFWHSEIRRAMKNLLSKAICGRRFNNKISVAAAPSLPSATQNTSQE